MAKLLVKYVSTDPATPGASIELDNVVDAGIANDFLVVRYSDGVVSFTKTEHIDSAQFDPTGDAPAETEGQDAEGNNDTSG